MRGKASISIAAALTRRAGPITCYDLHGFMRPSTRNLSLSTPSLSARRRDSRSPFPGGLPVRQRAPHSPRQGRTLVPAHYLPLSRAATSALNRSFHRRNSSTRLSRTLSADVATLGERALIPGIPEGGRGVANSSTWPSRALIAEVGTFDGRALRSGIAEGGRGVAPASLCPCAPQWAAYARSRESAEKAEPPIDRAPTTARPISKRFMIPSAAPAGLRVWSRC